MLEGDRILNDVTVARLVEQAVVQADAGADIVAPSDMMDVVGADHEQALFGEEGHADGMSWCQAKGAGGRGRRRDRIRRCAARRQEDLPDGPANGDEALQEVALDLAEGADMVMVKPGLLDLDIAPLKQAFRRPTFVYQVSGEYAMIKAAAAQGWLDEDRAILETLTAFKRAGADGW